MVAQRLLQALVIVVALASTTWAQDSADFNGARASFHLSLAIDLRTSPEAQRAASFKSLSDALGDYAALRPHESEELRAMLGRQPYAPLQTRGKHKLSEALRYSRSRNCKAALTFAQGAILDLAAAEARARGDRHSLRRAYLVQFQCAHELGRRPLAQKSAQLLSFFDRNERPPEVDASTWESYPLVDALSNLQHRTVSFIDSSATSPPNPLAKLWIDHREVDTLPAQVVLTEGTHLVAAGSETSAKARVIEVRGDAQIPLTMTPIPRAWDELQGQLDTLLRSRGGRGREQSLAAIMAASQADLAFLVLDEKNIEVWILPRGFSQPERVGAGSSASIAALLGAEALAEEEKILFQSEKSSHQSSVTSPLKWWIYGTILGVAAIGASAIVIKGLGEDTQRIEVTLP